MSEELKLPDTLGSIRIKVVTGCGSMYIHLSYFEGQVCEVFATLGHGGGCAAAESEALTRTISAGLRSGVSVDEYVKQLREIRCPNQIAFPHNKAVSSCPDAIGKALAKYRTWRVNVIEPSTEEEHKQIVVELTKARERIE